MTTRLLHHVTLRFHVAFECPLATASIYFTLAQLIASNSPEGRGLRRSLSLIQMGFIFTRDKGFYECSPWPIHGWDMLWGGHHLRNKIQALEVRKLNL